MYHPRSPSPPPYFTPPVHPYREYPCDHISMLFVTLLYTGSVDSLPPPYFTPPTLLYPPLCTPTGNTHATTSQCCSSPYCTLAALTPSPRPTLPPMCTPTGNTHATTSQCCSSPYCTLAVLTCLSRSLYICFMCSTFASS